MPFELQACKAHELAQRLTDEELFVLMACEGIGKSRQLRVFARQALRKPSVQGPLSERGHEVGDVIDALIGKGFLNRVGTKKLVCTDDGDLVKHAFNDLRDELVLNRTSEPLSGGAFDWVSVLRRHMEEVCTAQALEQEAEDLR